MMISSFYLYLNYFFSLILFINFNNPIFFWILMEFNLVSFILLLGLNKDNNLKQESLNYLIFYFLIQSSSSILFLSNYSLADWSSIFNYDVMFIVSLLFKIGLFPFFFWIFPLSEVISVFSLIFLLSFQKIPLFFGLFYSSSSLLLTLLFFSFVFGSIMLLFSSNFLTMLICSSISYGFMMFFLFVSSFLSFLGFFLLYSIFLYFCLAFSKSLLQSFLLLITTFVFFLGLPPLGLFFYKFTFSGLIYLFLGPSECFFFWGVSFLSMLGYLKFFYYSFFMVKDLYSTKLSFPMKNGIPYFMTFIFFLGFSF